MHRRELMVLHAVLIAAALLLSWRLVVDSKRANLRYQELAPVRPVAATAPRSAFQQVSLPPAGEIVAKNIFSSDRSSDLSLAGKAQPAPPAPVVFGTMNLGGRYEALMAESVSKPAFRRVKTGEMMGEYLVVEIADQKVTVDYQGQTTTLDVYQSANSVPRAGGGTLPPSVPAGPVVESVAAPPPPPAAAQGAAPDSMASDSGVRSTTEGTKRRMERQTPFGLQVWYEDVPK